MSWDFYLTEKHDVCPTCGRGKDELEVYDRNYTSNMWRMLRVANFNWDMIEGKAGAEALPELTRLIQTMQSDPSTFRGLNPPNGWGDYDSFLEMLREFREACSNHLTAIVHISR